MSDLSGLRRRVGALAALALLLATGAAAGAAPALPPNDATAVATRQVPPTYPPAQKDKGIDGCVVVSFVIDAEGRPGDIQVMDSQPKGAFDKATLKAFRQWRFQQPPRPGRYAQVVNYRLKDRPAVNTCVPLPGYAVLNPHAGPATRELRILQKVMPSYARDPDAADGGCVTVRFQIRYDGFVGEVTVLEARPESLAGPTIEALKQWQFQSFPPPDLYAVQTFNFAPEQVRLPETAVRASLAELAGGELHSVSCGAKPAVAGVKG